MMALPSDTSTKISKLIPRLGSDHEGEIVNTVRAIERTLDSQGLTLHDLAEAIGEGPQKPPKQGPATEPPQWAAMAYRERLTWLRIVANGPLNDWELNFLSKISPLVRRTNYPMSPKRQKILNEMIAKAWLGRAR